MIGLLRKGVMLGISAGFAVLACSAHTTEAADAAAPTDSGDASPTPSTPEPSRDAAGPAPIDLAFFCADYGRLDLAWAPVAGADRYVLREGDRVLAETAQTRLRTRGWLTGEVELRALAGDAVVAAWRSSPSPTNPGGDTLWLRGARADVSTVETIACLSAQLGYQPEADLPLESAAPVFPPGTSALSSRSAVVAVETNFQDADRPMAFLASGRVLRPQPTDAFLYYDRAGGVEHRDLGLDVDESAGLAQTSRHTFVADVAGSVWAVDGDESRRRIVGPSALAGRKVHTLWASEEAGLWTLAYDAAGSDHALLHFAAVTTDEEPDLEIALPEATTESRYVFDGGGLRVVNLAGSGHLYEWAPGGWLDRGGSFQDLRAIESSTQYFFAVGAAVEVLDRRSLTKLGSFRLSGVTNLDLMGHGEPFMRPALDP